jgi:hypothetical protein
MRLRSVGNDEREQTLNQLLTELDGFDRKKDSVVICIAATNRWAAGGTQGALLDGLAEAALVQVQCCHAAGAFGSESAWLVLAHVRCLRVQLVRCMLLTTHWPPPLPQARRAGPGTAAPRQV